MRKGLTTLLVILLAVGAMLVSCKAEVGTPADDLVSASFELGSSRALSATLEPFNPDAYYWKYAASKNEADTSGLHSGETAGYDISPAAREEGAQWIHENVTGLDGVVPGFSQGLWDFTLYAYKDAEGTKLAYLGEATAVTLVKGGTNMVHVVVSPAPTGTGTLYIGATSLKPRESTDVPTVARFLKVEDLDGHEYAPTSGTTYELEAGAYKVTVTYKTSGIVYAEGTVIATVYPNMTTTVTGSVDELVTYAQFEAEQNPDIIARTAEATGIRANDIVQSGVYTLSDTSASQTVPAVVTATIPEEAAKALIGSTDPSATMSLALNVDTTDSTSTSVTYEIGMTKTVTVNSQSTTSDVTHVDDFVSVELKLRTGLTGVAVVHGTTAMTPSATKDAYDASTVETFFYDSDDGKLYIKTMSFSPFAVTFDAETAGVAEVNGVKYATLKAAVEAANAGDTVKLLSDAEGTGMSINKNLTIDFQNHTYTGIGPGAGSPGTETQLFQLLGGEILFKNGTLSSVSGSGIKMLVNNYSNLTLNAMTLDGTNLDDSNVMYYTLSCNKGNVVITGNTTIIAHSDSGAATGKAFDVWGPYGGGGDRTVTFDENFTGEVKGIIEYTAAPAGRKAQLIIKAGDFSKTKLTVDGTLSDESFISIRGGVFGWNPWKYVADGYEAVFNPSTGLWTVSQLPVANAVAKLGGSYYASLDDAIYYADEQVYTIYLLRNVDLTSVLLINKSVVIEGNFHEITNTANRVIRITEPNLDISMKDLTITSKCTATSDVRGISFDNASGGSKLLLDGCSVSASFYAINAIPGADGLEVTIKNGTVAAGWAAINSYTSDSSWIIEDSVLRGLNDKGESEWNNFNTITFDGNCLNGGTVGSHGSNNVISISDSTIYASSESSNKQHWIGIQYGANGNTVTATGCSIIDDEGIDQSENYLLGSWYNYHGGQWDYYDQTSTITIVD